MKETWCKSSKTGEYIHRCGVIWAESVRFLKFGDLAMRLKSGGHRGRPRCIAALVWICQQVEGKDSFMKAMVEGWTRNPKNSPEWNAKEKWNAERKFGRGHQVGVSL